MFSAALLRVISGVLALLQKPKGLRSAVDVSAGDRLASAVARGAIKRPQARRIGAGEAPDTVICELRGRHAGQDRQTAPAAFSEKARIEVTDGKARIARLQ